MHARLLRRLLLTAAAVGLAASAQATPLIYNFASGSVTFSATLNGINILPPSPPNAPTSVALTGTQVTFDASPPNLVSFAFTGGPSGPIALVGPATGETITVLSLSASPGPGFGPLVPTTGGSNLYFFAVGPVAVSATVSGTGLYDFGPTTVSGLSTTPLTGTIELGGSGTTPREDALDLKGIALGLFNTSLGPITLKGDFIFFGVVPEPRTALLLASGLMAVAAARRRARS
jgi:hypothetical protein